MYPFNLKEIYPAVVTQAVESSEGYPYFNICAVLSNHICCTSAESFTQTLHSVHLFMDTLHCTIMIHSRSILNFKSVSFLTSLESLSFSHCATSDHELPALSCPTIQDVEVDIPQSIHLRKYPIFNICKAPRMSLYS